jgi:hypothetical protein
MTHLTDHDLFELAAPLRQVEAVTRAAGVTHRAEATKAGWKRRAVIGLLAAAATLAVLFVLALAAHSRSSAPAPAKPPAGHMTSFLAGLTPVRVHYSKPEDDGRLVVEINPAVGPGWSIFADGRVIGDADLIPKGANPLHMANSQQWLTRQGTQMLRSEILAIGRPVGLFTTHNVGLFRNAYKRHGLEAPEDGYDVRIGRRLISVGVFSPSLYRNDPSYRNDPEATPAQIHALAQINTLVNRLPASAWKDRTIRAYIPSHYCVAWDREAPDPAKLPPPANKLLAQRLPSWSNTASGTLTTDQARALVSSSSAATRRKFIGKSPPPTGTGPPPTPTSAPPFSDSTQDSPTAAADGDHRFRMHPGARERPLHVGGCASCEPGSIMVGDARAVSLNVAPSGT